MDREDKHLGQLNSKSISISLINSKSLSCKPLDKLMMLISMMLIDQWLALHRWGLWLMMKLVGVTHRTSNSSKSSFLDVVSQAKGVPPLRAGLNPRAWQRAFQRPHAHIYHRFTCINSSMKRSIHASMLNRNLGTSTTLFSYFRFCLFPLN